jgi:chromosome partitioning protein
MEAQASLSQFFLGPQAVERLPKEHTTAALFDEHLDPDLALVIRSTACDGIWLAPASMSLAAHELPCPQDSGAVQFALRDFLADVKEEFDFVLIDTPPAIYGLLAWSSLLSAQLLLSPVHPETFSAQAIIGVRQLLDVARQHGNPGIQSLGYIISMCERTTLHKTYQDRIREAYGAEVFKNVIPRLSAFSEAIPYQKPITKYKPKSDAAKVIQAVTKELLQRAEKFLQEPTKKAS